MKWEELTSGEFAEAVKETGVCVVACGVVEKHGDHLPLGTDFLNGHKFASLAAEKEPAVVFPPFYFGQIYEARCFPGTITLKPTVLLEVMQSVLDEIGRNGFKKIILFNAHGGNTHLLRFLAQCALWEEKPYSIYIPDSRVTPERQKIWDQTCKTSAFNHGGECETSASLANHAHLVKMDKCTSAGDALGRNNLEGFSGINWYADYPDHYAGDGRDASLEKGEVIRELIVDTLAEFIAAVKNDKVIPALTKEFFERVDQVGTTTS